jgi:hypothetical protein
MSYDQAVQLCGGLKLIPRQQISYDPIPLDTGVEWESARSHDHERKTPKEILGGKCAYIESRDGTEMARGLVTLDWTSPSA